MDHLDHVNDKVALQVLGLLKHLTYNASEHAQDSVFKLISSGESIFCERVYKLLENSIAFFNHPVLRSVLVCTFMNPAVLVHNAVYTYLYLQVIVIKVSLILIMKCYN